MPQPVFESPSHWPTAPAGRVPAAWVQLPSSAVSGLSASAALGGGAPSAPVRQPALKRRIGGFWMALLAIVLLVLVVAGMVLYRGSQTPPISTAQPPLCSGQAAVPTDRSV